MTIVGHFLPELDYYGGWPIPSWRQGPSFERWREPYRPTHHRSSSEVINIPIQVLGRRSDYDASNSWDQRDEWSDSDSEDIDINNSSGRMRRKRQRGLSSVNQTSLNDSIRNGSISRTEEEDGEELRRKLRQNTFHDDTRSRGTTYNTRSSKQCSNNEVPIPILIKSDTEEREINDTCSYSVYEYLKCFLASTGRQIDAIKGDGNCFFRALSKIIYGNQSYYDEVRQAIVEVLKKFPKKFEAFADGPISVHIEDMKMDKTWATQTEIYAAATLLNRDIYILSPDQTGEQYRWLLFQPQAKYNKNFTGCRCYITICHTHGNHYDRIAPLDGGCNCDLDPPEMTGVKGQVDLTLSEDEVV